MAAPSPSGFEEIRREAAIRLFQKAPWMKFVLFEPVFGGIAAWLALTDGDGWRRALALADLALLVALNLLDWRLPKRLAHGARWWIGIQLVAISGGLSSPLYPFILMNLVFLPVLFGRRRGLAMVAIALVVTWSLAALQLHGDWMVPGALLPGPTATHVIAAAACMTSLIVTAHLIGNWLRMMTDDMLQRSLGACDETLRSHADRLREMTTLSAQIAHELKNPLASVKGLAALMELEPARAPERLAVLQKEVNRMQSILEEFLGFSRPLVPLATEAVDLGELAGEVIALHEGVAGERRIVVRPVTGARVEAQCDRRKVKSMMINLVQNAIEASPDGGEVRVEVERHGDRAVLRVLDRGSGLPPGLGDRVLEAGVTTKAQGSGLGLTITRLLAEQHGGTLCLRDREGGGCVAEVTVRLEPMTAKQPCGG